MTNKHNYLLRFSGYQCVQFLTWAYLISVSRVLRSAGSLCLNFRHPKRIHHPHCPRFSPSFSPRVHAISIFQIEFPGILIFYYFRKLKEKTPPSRGSRSRCCRSLSAPRAAAGQTELKPREISSYDMHDMCLCPYIYIYVYVSVCFGFVIVSAAAQAQASNVFAAAELLVDT